MRTTKFQELMDKERMKVIKKFQKIYKTSEEKKKALEEMEDKDIDFLLYCSCNIHANIFYSQFLKRNKHDIITMNEGE